MSSVAIAMPENEDPLYMLLSKFNSGEMTKEELKELEKNTVKLLREVKFHRAILD